MLLMAVLCILLVCGVALALGLSGTDYSPAAAGTSAVRRYLRGVAVALVAGFWTGVLVTGPAVRLIMRLLAVTAGDDAQGRITEAEEVVGDIDLDGTLGLLIFGGLLPALVSAFLYVPLRALLPRGRWAGVTYGLLHLVVAATRLDPLRPENPDFDIVGPGWLSVLTFSVAAVLHGVAVAAFANRYSHEVHPSVWAERGSRWRIVAPLVPAALFLVPAAFLALPLAAGLLVAALLGQVPPLVQALRSARALLAGRVAVALVALALLPGAIADLGDIVSRPG